MAILKTVIFQRMHEKPTKFKKVFAMRLCRHILPGASARPVAGSWSDLSCSVRERSVLFLLSGTFAEEYFSNNFDEC